MKKIFGIFLMATAFFLVSCGGGSQPAGQEQDEDMVLEQNEVVAPAPTTPPQTRPEQRIAADTLKEGAATEQGQATPTRRGTTDSETEAPRRRGTTEETKDDKDTTTTAPRRRGS